MNASIEKYLKAYNLVQCILWAAALLMLPLHLMQALYIVLFAQSFSILEIYHAYKNWNSSSPFLCFIQIGARLFILYWTVQILFIALFNSIVYFNSVIHIMLAAWCIAEIIRYIYYVSQLSKKGNNTITWLRYSAFIICYPVGLACELFVLYTVFMHHEMTYVKIIVILTLIAYIFLFPKLYLHLLKQRKQKLIH